MIKLNLTGALRVSCDLLQNCMQNSFEPCAHFFNCSFHLQLLILFAIAHFWTCIIFLNYFWTCIIFSIWFNNISNSPFHFNCPFESYFHSKSTQNSFSLKQKKTRKILGIFDCQNKKSIEWIIIGPEKWRNVWKICERQLSCWSWLFD